MPQKPPHYALDYNDDGTPKVPVLLWLAIFYLSRHLLLVTIGGLNALQGLKRGGDISASFDIVSQLSSSPLFLIASIPAFAVLIVLFLRSHVRGVVSRTILANGRWLVTSSAVIDIAIMLLLWKSSQAQPGELALLSTLLDIYAAWYILRSPRVAAIFSDHHSLKP